MNKKGDLMALFVLLIVFFVAVMFFASWIYGFNLVTEKLEVLNNNPTTQKIIGNATRDTFSSINDAQTTGLKWVALAIFFGMSLSIFVSNFLVKAHPVFFVLYVLITIVAVIFSVYVSNTYEDILSNNVLSTTLEGFGAVNFLMLNLPIVITIIGFLGGMFLFFGITSDAQQGGSIL